MTSFDKSDGHLIVVEGNTRLAIITHDDDDDDDDNGLDKKSFERLTTGDPNIFKNLSQLETPRRINCFP